VVLLGREAEVAQVSDRLDAARRGESSVLVISGEPGIGKSALLAFAREQAGDAAVVSTTGVEGESEIPYVNLADILRPLASLLSQIPPRQGAALGGVLAIGPPDVGDRLAVAAATLSLLGVSGTDRPVLVTVDDAQWVDTFTTQVLLFVANRLGAEGIVLLIGVRSGHSLPAGFHRFDALTLGGVDDAAARRLVQAASSRRLELAVVSRLIAEAGGNPLALRELPTLLTPAQLAMWSRGADPLPIDSVMAEAYLGTVRDLPRDTQDALLLLAILGSVPIEIVEQALVASGLPPRALDPAEESGLIVWGGEQLKFRHPLVRAAVHQNSSSSQRRRAHLCAAHVLEDSDLPTALERRAWHLVSSGSSADESLAAVIDRAAEEEAARANFAVAGELFERAAQLTPAGGRVATRLLRAADANRLAGAVEQAIELLRQALPIAQEPQVRQRIRYFLCRIAIWRGSLIDGRNELLRMVDNEQTDPGLATLMLTVAALASLEAGEFSAAREASERAVIPHAQSPASLPVVVVRALVLGVGGDVRGARALLRERADEVDRTAPLESDLADQMLMVAGVAHLQLEETARAHALLDRAVAGARESSAMGVLPFRLGRLALAEYWRGRWSVSRALAHEALRLADDTGWVNERPHSLAALARVEAVTGRAEECRDHARQAEGEASASGASSYAGYARAALGLLELSCGNNEAAIGHLGFVAEFAGAAGFRDSPLLWWSGDLIEALVRRGDLGRARQALDGLDETVRITGMPTAAAVAARSRSFLVPDDFESHLIEALSWHDRCPMPFERARTELQLGIQLRRRRLRGEARPYLESALLAFERLGAPAWADQTRRELEATGVRLDAPNEGLRQLTPQELQVVLKVAAGMANREVAEQLFLSVKTVEFHLRNAFHKLGVKRRTQLAVLVAAHDPQVVVAATGAAR
jgi:DNA-binding CsgD family transcriptional regulator